jgi:acetylornithine/succinyldiaminopimelate/putrescine aminotransferase
MRQPPPLVETLAEMLRDREPNFLRLYLSPHVARACLCLDRYVRTTWGDAPDAQEDFQSFLANSLEEALSGAIKLVRFTRQDDGPPTAGLVLDPADRLTGFASAALADGGVVRFLPGLRVLGSDGFGGEGAVEHAAEEALVEVGATRLDPLVLVAGAGEVLDRHADAIRRLMLRHEPRVITCVDRDALSALRAETGGLLREVIPDVVVFDDTFTGRAVPFGAFTARRSLFAGWNRPGKSTFHSTTFQPNTVSTRHFLNCLAADDPEFVRSIAAEMEAVGDDLSRLADAFRRHYNPSLYRLIRATGFATRNVRAEGPFVVADGRPVYDVVGGVACSVRGHNPEGYLEETAALAPAGDVGALEDELRERLRLLTGLGHVLPAVSGASAVENALKLALVARFPRRHVLALKAGFGGKTLLALTGTANPKYKQGIDPLYADVHYVDPFAPDACAQIDRLMGEHEFAVVQVELVQSVGGVRRVPEGVVRHLVEGRGRWGYLLLVDEVQTGMYRTGRFALSGGWGVTPDLLLLGKGTSDMMFPFALTLLTDEVAGALEGRCPWLLSDIRRRYGYEQGYRTVLNVLRLAERTGLSERVEEAGALYARLISEGLRGTGRLAELRAFGLLIGVELDVSRRPGRWLGKRVGGLYLLAMLRHSGFPVFAGLCQYEPNVLKITPPLNATDEEIRRSCGTIVEVLKQPLPRALAAALGGLARSLFFTVRDRTHEPDCRSTVELAAR